MSVLKRLSNTIRRPAFIFGCLAVLVLFAAAIAINRWSMPVSMPASHLAGLDGPQVWGHRGSGGRLAPENTPEAVVVAVREGFPGVELDIFYDPDANDIIVSHDPPVNGTGNPGISLDAYDIPGSTFVWLDFKNLKSLQEKEVEAFVRKLQGYEFARNTFVESTSLEKLRLLGQKDIKTVLWLSGWKLRLIPVFKYYLGSTGISAVSVDYRSLSRVAPHFGKQSVFTFTVNDLQKIEEICQRKQVAVILTDLSGEEAGCPAD